MAESVSPLAGAGTGSLISSLGAIWSASASATISEMLSRARSPCSIRHSCVVLIPASPATTRSDLRRDLRT
jgi:hypothetical protein